MDRKRRNGRYSGYGAPDRRPGQDRREARGYRDDWNRDDRRVHDDYYDPPRDRTRRPPRDRMDYGVPDAPYREPEMPYREPEMPYREPEMPYREPEMPYRDPYDYYAYGAYGEYENPGAVYNGRADMYAGEAGAYPPVYPPVYDPYAAIYPPYDPGDEWGYIEEAERWGDDGEAFPDERERPEPVRERPAVSDRPEKAEEVFADVKEECADDLEDDFEDDFDDFDDNESAAAVHARTADAPIGRAPVSADDAPRRMPEHRQAERPAQRPPERDPEREYGGSPRNASPERAREYGAPSRNASPERAAGINQQAHKPGAARQNQKINRILPALLALMCVLAVYFVSSGHVIEMGEVKKEQRSAVADLQRGLSLMYTNALNDMKGLPKIYTLPYSNGPASKPLESGYSSYVDEDGDKHEAYYDETIQVDMSRKRYSVGERTFTVAVAHVKIAHPSQLRSGFAGGEYNMDPTGRAKPSQIAELHNAVVALNGEFYNYANRESFLIRGGTVYRTGTSSLQALLIDYNGDFRFMTMSSSNIKKAVNSGKIMHSVFFGPALVNNGEITENLESGPDGYFYNNPRSALGQIGKLEYIFAAVEGRSTTSKGCTISELAVLMKNLGCNKAYNVDGGQSSMLIFRNKPYNNISNGGERQFGDIIYFGSALPSE